MAFPPDLSGADEADLFQHMQVFRYRLAGKLGAGGEAGDRALAPVAEGCQQRQARRVSQGGKQGCRIVAAEFNVSDRGIP
jgi:hypothetical protein